MRILAAGISAFSEAPETQFDQQSYKSRAEADRISLPLDRPARSGGRQIHA